MINTRVEVLLASHGQRRGLLLNILQYRQPPSTKGFLVPNVSSVKGEKPCYICYNATIFSRRKRQIGDIVGDIFLHFQFFGDFLLQSLINIQIFVKNFGALQKFSSPRHRWTPYAYHEINVSLSSTSNLNCLDLFLPSKPLATLYLLSIFRFCVQKIIDVFKFLSY